MITHNSKHYVCHMDLAMDLIKGKWKAVILCHLSDGPKRFLELQRITGSVSQKVLNEKLIELEADGIISKTTFPEVPPRVEFTLTDKGEDLYRAIHMLEQWAHKYY